MYFTDKTDECKATENKSSNEPFGKESPKQLLENASTFEDLPYSPDDVWTQGPYPHKSSYK